MCGQAPELRGEKEKHPRSDFCLGAWVEIPKRTTGATSVSDTTFHRGFGRLALGCIDADFFFSREASIFQ